MPHDTTANRRVLVTGGAGFIGSALIRHLLARRGYEVLNVDKLTYAASLASLAEIQADRRYQFLHADVADAGMMQEVFDAFRPRAVVHLAAESHVDRSIAGPEPFLHSNVLGTACLLSEALRYWERLPAAEAREFRFVHVSTDEVFGQLGDTGRFVETSPYRPNSPYAASKAAADHFVRAWGRTYGLPVVVTNCSNNYGPFHFPEKLIPLAILKCLGGEPIPVYGDGQQVRDWLYVYDHAEALRLVMEHGEPGESYNIGGASERSNLHVVEAICALLDSLCPPAAASHRDLIAFVDDRPGHDRRYAIDFSKLTRAVGWRPRESFESGLEKTVRWYLDAEWWWGPIVRERYNGARLGLRERVAMAGAA